MFKTSDNKLLMLDTAKHDHILFVNRIGRCLDGKEQIQSSTLPDHTCCRFGKWYFSDGKALCGSAPSFNAINPPHELIHRIAKEAVDCFNHGDTTKGEEMLTRVEDISSEIVHLLEQVKGECKFALC
jgi:methyl-accepting chemotaxis protein